MEHPTAAELARELNDRYAEVGFERLRAALIENDSFTDVNAALGDLGAFMQERISPQIEIDFTRFEGIAPDQALRRQGHEGWVELWRTFGEPWSEWKIENPRFDEIDPELAVASSDWFLRGRESGVELTLEQAALWRSRAGLLTSLEAFANERDARAAIAA
jgi:hypothetical protein